MIKANARKILCILLSAYMGINILLFPTTGVASVQASTSYITKGITMYFRPKNTNNIYSVLPIPEFPKNAKITELKSSNTKVGIVKYNHIFQQILLKEKKTGAIFVSFKMTVEKKSKFFRYKVSLKKAVNPCISFKIGSKNYAREFNNQSFYTINIKKNKKMKISIKPRSDWMIIKISKHVNGKGINIKNNSIISFKKEKNKGIYVIFKNKKTNRIDILNLYFK